jgi:hypothetical protein
MDRFTGFKTATVEELPDAVAVMDPFHVVRLRGDALDGCRRRVQQDLHGHRGRADDPLYGARRLLYTERTCSRQAAPTDQGPLHRPRRPRGSLTRFPGHSGCGAQAAVAACRCCSSYSIGDR